METFYRSYSRSSYTFKVEEDGSGDVCLKILEGDFQYYIVICRKYGLSVVAGAGLLHFEMAGADVIWRLFRHSFLYSLNKDLKYNCPWNYGTGKYGRYKRLIKHTFGAVVRILRDSSVSEIPNTLILMKS